MNRVHPIVVLSLSVIAVMACQLAYVLPSQTAATPTPRQIPTLTSTPVARVGAPPTYPPTAPPVPVTAMTTANLRIRNGPSTSAAIVGRLEKETRVQVVGRTPTSDWWQIPLPDNPNQRGWISAEFTQTNGPVDSVPIVQPGSTSQPRPPTPPAYPYP